MTLRVLVTGGQGQVDTALMALSGQAGVEIIRLGRPDIDLADLASLAGPIKTAKPDVLISSAAYTAVDRAESEPDLAQIVNGDAPGKLAQIAADLHIPILHLSTDYVFSGDKAGRYTETDVPDPVSVYGTTKLSGEVQVAQATANHAILRTAWVYSPFGANFVKTMLRLGATRDEIGVVADQHGCPNYAPALAEAILTMAQRLTADADPALRGVFHLSQGEETSWAGFATEIFRALAARGGKSVTVRAITTADYPTPARRPMNSRLDPGKLQAVYGIRLDPWRVSLDHCLDALLPKA